MGFLCCVSGPLSTTFCTDRGGYCPGETIGVSMVIDNKSKNEVVGLKIQLLRIIVLIASCGGLRRFLTCELGYVYTLAGSPYADTKTIPDGASVLT